MDSAIQLDQVLMIRIQLPFDSEDDYEKTSEAVDWLVKRLGHITDIKSLGLDYRQYDSWRYMSPAICVVIMDYLNGNGIWWHCSDLYIGTNPNKNHYQQFFIQDPDIALLFKLTFGGR